MPKILETLKITIRLADGDRERLQKYYPSVPYNKVIRTLVQEHLDALDKRLERLHRVKLPTVED